MILKKIQVKNILMDITNCYVLTDEKTKETMVIDPGGEIDKITEVLNLMEAKLKYIYITHCHIDHILMANELKNKYNAKILAHRICAENLKNPDNVLTSYLGLEETIVEVDSRVDDEDLIHLGDEEIKVIFTPGHTNGGTSLYIEKEKMLFSGDTLFKGSIGRTDLPTSSFNEIMNSVEKRLLKLPEETIVYPGHGLPTRVIDERKIYFDFY